MEFTSFKKKDHVSDDELLQAVLQFEEHFLTLQEGVIFHCLVRNYKNEYANVLFADHMDTMNAMFKSVHENDAANRFFDLIEEGSVTMNFNQIQKEDFKIPKDFSCVEYGTFSLRSPKPLEELITISDNIENHYLNTTENTQAHFIGTISDTLFSEVTFGKTLAKTKEVCYGYTENIHCKPLLDAADPESMQLDFWYLIA